MQLVELSRQEHAVLKINPAMGEASAAQQHLIPIVPSEFRKAATQYPIVFAKHPETGRFAAYALCGLEPKENLFWSGSQLDVGYVPLNIRRLPFYVGMDDAAGGAGNVLCIDIESPCLTPSGEKSIVDADGGDSAYLRDMLSLLRQLLDGQQQVGGFIKTALSLNLLCPIVLDIVLESAKPLRVEGLYGIDEDRFRALERIEVEKLWDEGTMELIYCAIVSTGQIHNLVRLRNQRDTLNRAWHDNEP